MIVGLFPLSCIFAVPPVNTLLTFLGPVAVEAELGWKKLQRLGSSEFEV